MAAPDKTKQEVNRLREQIDHHNRLYHSLDSPEIPDADFDALLARLQYLEDEYNLTAPDSPTQRVGSETNLLGLRIGGTATVRQARDVNLTFTNSYRKISSRGGFFISMQAGI